VIKSFFLNKYNNIYNNLKSSGLNPLIHIFINGIFEGGIKI